MAWRPESNVYETWPLEDLRQLRANRAELVKKLEDELLDLEEPSDLARRISTLEGGVDLAKMGPMENPRLHARQLHDLVADIRERHHHSSHAFDYGQNMVHLDHGHVFDVPEHPVRQELLRDAEQRKRREAQNLAPPSSYIGAAGAFASSYTYVPGPCISSPEAQLCGVGGAWVLQGRVPQVADRVQWQMAHMGAVEQAPAVTPEWLERHGIVHGFARPHHNHHREKKRDLHGDVSGSDLDNVAAEDVLGEYKRGEVDLPEHQEKRSWFNIF